MSNNPMLSTPPHEYYDGETLLIAKAIRGKDHHELSALLRDGTANLMERGKRDMPLVVYAASLDNIDAVRALLEAGAPANDTFNIGWVNKNLVSLAAGSENPQFLDALLDAGANPNGVKGTEPPLFTTVFGKRWDRMDLLIERGADINLPSETGDIAIMKLAYIGEYEQVLRLLKLGGDPDHKSNIGASLRTIMQKFPLDPGSEKGHWQHEVIRYLQNGDKTGW